FLPKMCVEQEVEQGLLREVKVDELNVERKIRLVYPARRALSHAARAFLEVAKVKRAEEASAPQGPPETRGGTP
ncbi:MAG: LysR family transcriptional regulator, partial [Bryobacteraceae bacterium]|nr:LysR family transcriptional regulator [Bryobacteraceae bacterium]